MRCAAVASMASAWRDRRSALVQLRQLEAEVVSQLLLDEVAPERVRLVDDFVGVLGAHAPLV